MFHRTTSWMLCVLAFFASPRIGSAQPVCNVGEVRALNPNGGVLLFSTIQSAVDAAGSGWRILVGSGFYSGVVTIDQKDNLFISTECGASVSGFRIKRSSFISLENFDVDASGTGDNGITLLGGINKNDSVTISNNDVHDAGIGRSGISVARDNTNVTISGNTIHDNDRNGIVFIDSTGGPNFVNGNTIVENGWNGVRVNRQHDVTITNNNVSGNGTASGSTGGRYGILRERISGTGDPDGITLLFNRVEGNQGVEVTQQSSIDLGNYDQMLDAGDSGNITTAGTEAAATGVLFDCNLFSAWQTVDDFQLVPGKISTSVRAAKDTNPNPVVDDGDVYVIGWADDGSGGFHGLVRKSKDGGLTWRVVRDIPPGPGSPPQNRSFGRAVATDANGNVYIAANSSNGTQIRWTVESSSDQGVNWQSLDSFLFPDVGAPLGNAAIPFDISLSNGDILVTGHANDQNNFFRWITRRKLQSDSAFVTIDSHDLEGTPASPHAIAADSVGNLLAAGQIWSPGFRWTVRRSPTGAVGTWSTVDQFVPSGGGDSSAVGILFDSMDNVLVAGDGGSPRKAFVRRSSPGGTSWEASPIYTFQLAASVDTFVLGFEKDSSGNLFLMMRASDGISNRWLVQKSTDQGQTFQTIDDFAYPGLSASGALSLVEGQVDDRSLYVSGQGGDFLDGTSRWVVRKQPCLSPRALTNFGTVAAAVDGSHSCAIASDGSADCWGRNQNGQIGIGQSTADVEFAMDVVNLTGVTATQIGTGTFHTCAVTTDGLVEEVRCWGGNFSGQLGIGSTGAGTPSPVVVPGTAGNRVVLSVGANHTCAIVDGILKCWGNNNSGQLGLGDQLLRSSPTVVPIGGVDLIDVAAGFSHTCAVVSSNPSGDSDNEVLCWGQNSFGAVGVSGPGPVLLPSMVSAAQGANRVSTGQHLSCALINQGVRCWGDNASGQLGRGTTGPFSATPMDVQTIAPGVGAGVSALDAGDDHVCVIVRGGLKCWGDNTRGQLGSPQATPNSSTPAQVAGYGPGSSLIAVSAGEQYTCASNGYVTCWGIGTSFRRGDGLGTGNQAVAHPVLHEMP